MCVCMLLLNLHSKAMASIYSCGSSAKVKLASLSHHTLAFNPNISSYFSLPLVYNSHSLVRIQLVVFAKSSFSRHIHLFCSPSPHTYIPNKSVVFRFDYYTLHINPFNAMHDSYNGAHVHSLSLDRCPISLCIFTVVDFGLSHVFVRLKVLFFPPLTHFSYLYLVSPILFFFFSSIHTHIYATYACLLSISPSRNVFHFLFNIAFYFSFISHLFDLAYPCLNVNCCVFCSLLFFCFMFVRRRRRRYKRKAILFVQE